MFRTSKADCACGQVHMIRPVLLDNEIAIFPGRDSVSARGVRCEYIFYVVTGDD